MRMKQVGVAILGFLLTATLSAQVTITGMMLEDVTITAGAVSAPAEDWSGSMVAVYDFESSGSPWDASGGTCASGTDCDLAATGSPARTTTAGEFIEGTAGAKLDASTTDYIGCTGTTCENTLYVGGSFTVGYWGKYDSTVTSAYSMGRDNNSGDGYFVYRQGGTQDKGTCKVGADGSSTSYTHVAGYQVWADDTWMHFACVYDESANTLNAYENGVDDTPASTSTVGVAGTNYTDIRYLSNGATAGTGDSHIDEIFVYDGVLTTTDVARMAACGIDGSECTCEGATYTDTGKTSENCVGSGDPYACCTGSEAGCIDESLLTDDCNKAAP